MCRMKPPHAARPLWPPEVPCFLARLGTVCQSLQTMMYGVYVYIIYVVYIYIYTLTYGKIYYIYFSS